jgi:arylsulfatase A-like enzyme
MRAVPFRFRSALALLALVALAGPALASSHVVYDLRANRGHAHLLRGGGVAVDAGSWSFPRYIDNIRRERWSVRVQDGKRSVSLSDKRQSWLFVPLSADEAARVRRLRLHVQPGRAGAPLTVSLNGRKLPAQTLAAGWSTVSFELPAGAAVAGENSLALDFGAVGKVAGRPAAGGLAWLSFDDGSQAAETAPDLTLADPSDALSLPGGGGLAWYVFVPEGGSLALTAAGSGPPCRVSVTAQGPSQAASGALSLTAGGAETAFSLDLTALQGDVARVSLVADPGCGSVALRTGGLARPGPAATFSRGSVPAPKRVILYLIDTLRADRLKSYNPTSRVRTPALDRLAAEGTVYLQNYSQGNESYVSHAAIFTGMYPMANGVFEAEKKLTPAHTLISEAVKKAGLRTAGFSSNGYIDVRNGYLQGWDTYVNTLVQKKPYKAPGLLAQVRSWAEKQGDAPYFLYVGTVDCHVTYRAYPEILPIYDPEPYSGQYKTSCGGDELGKIRAAPDKVSKRDRIRIEALYDNTVDFSDRHLKAFLEFLEERGQLDETMIIVTSDHGDEFWEHGSVGHAHTLYEELVHVPFIVRYPPLFPKGARVKEGVDTVDIFPTILDALGADIPASVQGTSALPLAHGVGAGYPRASIATRSGLVYAVRVDRYKMILKRQGHRRLYDLTTDPTEQTDVIARQPLAARFVMDAAGLFIHYEKDWRKAEWGSPANLAGVPPLVN